MENEKDVMTIPYFCHEGDMNRLERVNKRQFVVILILIIALVGSNLAWIVYENQYEDVVTTETVTQSGEVDGDGDVLLNNGGDLNYGYESKSDDN